MPSGTKNNPVLKEVGAVLLMNTLIGLGLALIQSVFGAPRVLGSLTQNLISFQVYTHIIGGMAALAIPPIAYRLAPRPPLLRWPLFVAILALIGLVGAALAGVVMLALGAPPEAYWFVLNISGRFSVIITILIGVGAYVSEDLKERLQATTLTLREHELERERALKAAAEADLSSLHSRLQPHFLFNTINSIQALIPVDPARAEQMLGRLARLLRSVLDMQNAPSIPLGDELRLLHDYLEIEQMRFGARLRYSVDVPEALAATGVPAYCLQTLAENSVKYAVAARRNGAELRIAAREEGGMVVLEVGDDGPGFHISECPAGHGIDTLRRRMRALYGDRAALTISNGAGARVELRIPAV